MTDELYAMLISAVRIMVELKYGDVDLISSGAVSNDEESFVFEVLERPIIVTVTVGADGSYNTNES